MERAFPSHVPGVHKRFRRHYSIGMRKCELLAKCPFFNDVLENMPSSSGFMKSVFCLNNFQSCARYQVFMGTDRNMPPPDLFPNDSAEARKIIARYKRFH